MASVDGQPVSVTLAEIARIAGVGRAAVSNWRRRYASFPEPVGGSDTSPLFSLSTVESWLREHKGPKVQAGALERFWPRFEALGDRDAMGRVIAALGAEFSDGVAPTAELAAAERVLLGESVRLSEKEGASATFEFLLDRWLRTHVRQISTTPDRLCDLMAEMAEVGHGRPVETVLDPACGTGTLLLAAARRWAGDEGFRLAGQDSDSVLASVAAARLAMAEGLSLGTGSVEIRTADTLRADAHAGISADVVLCNPPANERDWGHGELATDIRWVFGQPSRTESELAWVQHVISTLSLSGIAIVLLPPAVASRRAGRRIRAALLRSGALRAVVALPIGAAPPHGIGLHLWVLRRPKPDLAGDELLLVDTADCRATASVGRPAIDWASVRERVGKAFKGERVEGSAQVPVIDLLDEQVDIAPGRHVPSSEATTAIRLRQTWTNFNTHLTEVADLAQALSALAPVSRREDTSSVTVADLERAGAVQIEPGRSLPEANLHRGPRPPGGIFALTLGDLLVDDDPEYWLMKEEAERLTVTASHDVVMVNASRSFDVWVETNAPTVLGPQFQVVRPDPAVIDPWFLAACLRAPGNARQASTHASSSSRIDARRLHVLRLPIDEQCRYGELYRKVVAFEQGVRALGADGGRLRRTIEELLSAGRLPMD